MDGHLATLTALLTSEALRAAVNSRLSAAGLPPVNLPFRRHRRLLREAGTLPAVALELGELAGRAVATGLRALDGEATWWLALGGADEYHLLPRAVAAGDALREAIEATLTGELQRLAFAGSLVEGELWREGGAPIRLIPVRFAVTWLYEC